MNRTVPPALAPSVLPKPSAWQDSSTVDIKRLAQLEKGLAAEGQAAAEAIATAERDATDARIRQE